MLEHFTGRQKALSSIPSTRGRKQTAAELLETLKQLNYKSYEAKHSGYADNPCIQEAELNEFKSSQFFLTGPTLFSETEKERTQLANFHNISELASHLKIRIKPVK